MRSGRITTMPLQKTKRFEITIELRLVFDQLRELIMPYSKWLITRVNSDRQFELWTNHVFRSTSFHAKDKRGILFGGLMISRTHVGFYFYPLYVLKTLGDKLTGELQLYRKGESSAFHFSEPLHESLQQEFTDLLQEGWNLYAENHWVSDSRP